MPANEIAQMLPLRQTRGRARAQGKKSFKPLVKIQDNYTDMYLMMPSTKIAQMVLRRSRGLSEL